MTETKKQDPNYQEKVSCFSHNLDLGAKKSCYKIIKNRGRTYDAVFNSYKYKPFSRLLSTKKDEKSVKELFDIAWQNNKLYVMANLAHASYLKDNKRYGAKLEVDAMFEKFGAKVQMLETKNVQAYIVSWPDKAVLVFRGTEPPAGNLLEGIRDIKDDLKIKLVKFKGAFVHHGFHDAAMKIWKDENIEQKLEVIKDALIDPREVYVTGHSLGAALAVISGITYPFKEVITFGEPRVGANLEFAWPDSSRHIRVVNGNDNVTKVPLRIKLFNKRVYKHHGKLTPTLFSGRPSFTLSPFLINKDHSIINYCENLWDEKLFAH